MSRGEGGDWVQVGVAVDSDGCAADRHVQLQPARYAPAVYISVISESLVNLYQIMKIYHHDIIIIMK